MERAPRGARETVTNVLAIPPGLEWFPIAEWCLFERCLGTRERSVLREPV